jgi:hypothetical protein
MSRLRRCAAGRQLTAAAVVTAAVACALAGCMGRPPAARASAAAPAGTIWLLTRAALRQVTADPAVRARLNRSRIYEILQPGQEPLADLPAVPVVTFSALAPLAAALRDHELPAGTRAVLYDPEAWPFTPADEQREPAAAAARAAELAHAHGLQLIAAPALNLTTVLAPGSRTPRWRTFLDLHLAAEAARTADIVDLQAQSLERDPAAYAQFVRAAAGQAQAANPEVRVLSGLSTNPPGAPVNSQQLLAAIRVSRELVDGYWLNIPGRGPRCPTCNATRPDVGIEALRGAL